MNKKQQDYADVIVKTKQIVCMIEMIVVGNTYTDRVWIFVKV